MDYLGTSLSNVPQSSSASGSASAQHSGERPSNLSLCEYYPFVNSVADPGLAKAVEQTICSRHKKLQAVPDEVRSAHNAIKDYAYRHAKCYLNSGNAEAQQQLKVELKDLQNTLGVSGFDVMYLQAISNESTIEDILFYTEITLNKVVDQAFFTKRLSRR